MQNLYEQLAGRTGISAAQAKAAADLLQAGNTVPFIARYRKEQTGELDDVKLRLLERELASLERLEERRQDIIRLLTEQEALTPALRKELNKAESISRLEDLYRPYRPKRRTRAAKAREAGLLPLAAALKSPDVSYKELLSMAEQLKGKEGYPESEDVLRGAQDILAESLADSPQVRERMRRRLKSSSVLTAEAKQEGDSVYRNYYDFTSSWQRLKGYQVLALNRGEKEEYLKIRLDDTNLDGGRELEGYFHPMPAKEKLVAELCDDAWKRLLKPSLETELRNEKTAEAHEEAMEIFAKNLRDTLLAPPLRGKTVLALDPGFRNGVKLAVCDPQGKVLAAEVIYPHPPQKRPEEAAALLSELAEKYQADCLALGNGTATRETETFLDTYLSGPVAELPLLIVNEAGASVYSASEAAAEELPDMDVSLRSAVSLARRVQDPLAELVKVEPKALGLGQYQHDMNQKELSLRLDRVVEDCVNLVGCDLNTASAALLSHIAGIGPATAENIVHYREENGAFHSRSELKKVPRLGPKAFEQCAGFLRIPESKEFLDNTSVHPESYAAAKKLLRKYPSATKEDFAESLSEKEKKTAG